MSGETETPLVYLRGRGATFLGSYYEHNQCSVIVHEATGYNRGRNNIFDGVFVLQPESHQTATFLRSEAGVQHAKVERFDSEGVSTIIAVHNSH